MSQLVEWKPEDYPTSNDQPIGEDCGEEEFTALTNCGCPIQHDDRNDSHGELPHDTATRGPNVRFHLEQPAVAVALDRSSRAIVLVGFQFPRWHDVRRSHL